MTKENVEDRVAKLEEHIAHQAHTIDELSEQLAEQWKTVENLRSKQEKLIERFLALEEQSAEAPPITKPPHY
ncbi:SlyX family protein [Hoeflea sp. TYP-13]|uniref:SlyX family protein n=1 Tax=Hoeflea sp. TYP-13 TaxID=3230023 RepID=UPI0034C61630